MQYLSGTEAATRSNADVKRQTLRAQSSCNGITLFEPVILLENLFLAGGKSVVIS